MSRVLMIGYGPLPQRNLRHAMGPALRTRQLLKAALDGGHTVNLFTLPIPGTGAPADSPPGMNPAQFEGHQYQHFTRHSGEHAIRTLNDQVRRLEPDALVGVNTYPAYVAASLSTVVPLWADLNGSYLAEIQGRCWADGDDARLTTAWAIERAIVRRLDKFSTVARAHLHALLGEMATIGRLNRLTFEYPFGHRMAHAAHRWDGPEEGEGGPIVRGPIVPEDAFIILWSGGFNLWADIDTLVGAMTDLMDHHPEVHFVSTGAKIEGVDTRTYARFEKAVEASPHKDRFHLMGWLPTEQLPAIYREADLGINVDAPNYETFFGGRQRLATMAAAGLPIFTTVGTEISEWLLDGEAALTGAMGDPHGVVAAIEPYVENREGLKEIADRAKRIAEEDFSLEATTRPLAVWLKKPALAPDNESKIEQSKGEIADLGAESINTLDSQTALLDNYDPRSLMQTQRELESFRRSPVNRLMKRVKELLGE